MNEARFTRRQILTGAVAAATGAGLSACGDSAPSTPPPTGTSGVAATSTSGGSTSDSALRAKIASLLVVGFRGETVAAGDWIVTAIASQGLGGVILFDRDQLTGSARNITSPPQVTSLIHDLRSAAPGRLIVSIDQEGGKTSRLNPADGFPAVQSEADIGAANSAATTQAWAEGLVQTLSSIGITMNFAPVVDLNVNPNNPAIGALGRSFSADPNVVVANATEEIKAHRAAGIRTSLKHFPGFGSATGNTDFDVVDVSTTWHRSELEPFQRLIAAGMTDSVLVAHLLNSQLDPTLPASLSPKVVTDLLRGQLGWTGPVVSDDMQAKAITSKYGRADATTMAIEAGVDLLVFANQQVYDPNIVRETVDTIVDSVHSGRISEARIDQSVARVNAIRPAG